MNQALEYISGHWFAGLTAALALLAAAAGAWLRRRGSEGARPLLLLCCVLGLYAAGGLAAPPWLGLWLAVGALALLFVMVLTLTLTGGWWAPLGYAAGAALLLGLGAWSALAIGRVLRGWGEFLGSLEIVQPWWLLFLLVVPLIVLFSFRSLAGLGPVRRALAIALRCLLVVLLATALTEVRASHEGDTTVVLFVVDCSHSVEPDVYYPVIEQFLNSMAEQRAADKYQVGVVLFGRQARVVRSASDTPRLSFKIADYLETIDQNYTDVAAGLRLAMASFPRGSRRRIVLVSDGSANLGDAEEQANAARAKKVQIDVVPLGVNRRKENEVLIDSFDVPTDLREADELRITVVLRSYNPNVVQGRLQLQEQVGDAPWTTVKFDPATEERLNDVRLYPGKNEPIHVHLKRDRDPENKRGSYSYQVSFVPERVLSRDETKVLHDKLPGDLTENNKATTAVVKHRKEAAVLILEPHSDEFQFLEEHLPTASNPRWKDKPKYVVKRKTSLTQNEEQLKKELRDYDCVVLANVPAKSLSEGQQKVLRNNTRDLGCGLIMIGGSESFGAGAWQKTPIEEALPVDTDIRSSKVQGKVGLVLIMHASEMPKGNDWQKQIAKVAIKELSSTDEVGIIYFDFTGTKWHIKLQEIGDNKEPLLSKVDSLSPGDMPDFDPALKMAYEALTEEKRELVGKHVILISDGDPVQNDANLLKKMKQDKVTATTVGVATHGAPEDKRLQGIADATGGRYYNVKNPNALPAIYLKETRLISQDFLYQKPFDPALAWRTGPAERLPARLPQLGGFVRTTPKPTPAVVTAIKSPAINGVEFPVLAYWKYGLGNSVAFTSDAAAPPGKKFWAKPWFDDGLYGKFWEQVLDWSLRPPESSRMAMTTELKDGKVRVVVKAWDDDNKPQDNLTIRGGVATPISGEEQRPIELRFRQTNSGTYEAEFPAQMKGSYFVEAQAIRRVKKKGPGADGKDEEVEENFASVPSQAVSVHFSPEFATVESNPALLRKIAEATGGMVIAEDRLQALFDRVQGKDKQSPDEAAAGLAKDVYRSGAPGSAGRQPIWFWLVFLTGVLLCFDVAVRRISLDPGKVTAAAGRYWERLRGRSVAAATTPGFMERLRSRKERVGESLDKARSERRFEGGDAPASAPPGAGDAPARPPPPRPAPRPAAAPEPEAEAGDFGSRLLRAKKRVWQERQQDKDEDK